MSIKRLEGPNGSYMDVVDKDGYYTFVDLIEYNKDRYQRWNSDYKARPDDILICEYPKSVPYNSWFHYTREWERYILQNRSTVHILVYEELLTHPLEELTRLARFLGLQPKTQFLQDIQRACSFNNLKEVKDKLEIERFGSELFNKKYVVFRKGTMDGWKERFTAQQNEQFVDQYAKEMANSKVQLKCLL